MMALDNLFIEISSSKKIHQMDKTIEGEVINECFAESCWHQRAQLPKIHWNSFVIKIMNQFAVDYLVAYKNTKQLFQ